MIMRMADTVEAMLALMHADYPVDGLVLLRALYEEVVGYLWIATNPDTNLLRWIEGARAWELKMHNDATNYGMEILSPQEVEACHGARMIPDLAQRAAEVDKHWGGRLIGFRPAKNGQEGILTFRGLYVAIYRFASRAAHGQPNSLSPYADAKVYPARVSRSEPAPESIWWPLAVPLFAHALIVCNEHLGWPQHSSSTSSSRRSSPGLPTRCNTRRERNGRMDPLRDQLLPGATERRARTRGCCGPTGERASSRTALPAPRSSSRTDSRRPIGSATGAGGFASTSSRCGLTSRRR
jgi:hypothetical protein